MTSCKSGGRKKGEIGRKRQSERVRWRKWSKCVPVEGKKPVEINKMDKGESSNNGVKSGKTLK